MALFVQRLSLAEIIFDPDQPRRQFDPERVAELAANIKEVGLLTPIRVRRHAALSKWIVVCGHRRVMALQLNGATEVDAIDIGSEPDAAAILAEQISENEQREAMTLGELARSVQRYKELTHASSKQVAAKLGFHPVKVSRIEDYFAVPSSVQALCDAGLLPSTVVSALARHPDPQAQIALADAYREGRISTEAITAEAQRAAGGKRERKNPGKRIALKRGSLTLSVLAQQTSADDLLSELDELRKELRKAVERGLSLPAFAKVLQATL